MKDVTDEKSVWAYLKARDNLVMRDGLLYHKLKLSTTGKRFGISWYQKCTGVPPWMDVIARLPIKAKDVPSL